MVLFDVNYNLISVLNCISYLVTQNFDPPFRLCTLEVEVNETRVECQSPRAIRNLNTLSSTARRTFIFILIGNVWNTRRGSVKVLKSWAHTRHTTRSGAQQMRRCGGGDRKNVLFGFQFRSFFFVIFSLILQGHKLRTKLIDYRVFHTFFLFK